MNDFREWLSDNLRYILLGLGIILILAVLFFGIRFATSALSGGDEDSTENTEVEAQTETEGAAADEQEKEPEHALQLEEDSEVAELIRAYYTALGEKDVASLKSVVDELDPSEEAKVTNARYIDGYSDIQVYTTPGLTEGDQVVFARYNYLCTGVATPVPALSQLYVVPDASGKLVISEKAEDDPEIQEYVTEVLNGSDVRELILTVEEEYNHAQESDPSLKTFLDDLGTAQSVPEAAFAGETMTVSDGCNVRAEADGESEVVDSLEQGTQVEQIGTEGEWIHVEYDGMTGYIHESLLE